MVKVAVVKIPVQTALSKSFYFRKIPGATLVVRKAHMLLRLLRLMFINRPVTF